MNLFQRVAAVFRHPELTPLEPIALPAPNTSATPAPAAQEVEPLALMKARPMEVATTALTVLSAAGAAVDDIQSVEAFIQTMAKYADTTGATGAQKLNAVLNAVKTYVSDALPQLKVDWKTFAVQVTAFINGLVALWRSLEAVVDDVKTAVTGAETAVKAAA